MTYREALQAGYQLADSRMFRGYISRKTDVMEQYLQTAGGSRAGDIYIEIPSYTGTRYYTRQYLTAPDQEDNRA